MRPRLPVRFLDTQQPQTHVWACVGAAEPQNGGESRVSVRGVSA